MDNGYSPTQQRILNLLADGKPHSKDEIHELLEDDLAPVSAIHFHITQLRKKLEGRGQNILCVLHRRNAKFQQVRNLVSPYDGRS